MATAAAPIHGGGRFPFFGGDMGTVVFVSILIGLLWWALLMLYPKTAIAAFLTAILIMVALGRRGGEFVYNVYVELYNYFASLIDRVRGRDR